MECDDGFCRQGAISDAPIVPSNLLDRDDINLLEARHFSLDPKLLQDNGLANEVYVNPQTIHEERRV